MQGILNVDKPPEHTSHDVVQQIRRVIGVRRVGHAGTLDPLATGVLLVCVGAATRLVEYLMARPKTYEALVRLGEETNTYDAEGDLVAKRSVNHVTSAVIETTLEQFRGEIMQRPPLYSAIKKDGQPLYKLARQGVDVDVPTRTVTIYSLELLNWRPPDVTLRVRCSQGTYIRSLAHDLGQGLGCGGHIAALQRTAIGDFTVEAAVALAALTPENVKDYLLPADTAVSHLPALTLTTEEATRWQHGQQVARLEQHPDASIVRTYDVQGHFIGISQAQDNVWQPRKVFVTNG